MNIIVQNVFLKQLCPEKYQKWFTKTILSRRLLIKGVFFLKFPYKYYCGAVVLILLLYEVFNFISWGGPYGGHFSSYPECTRRGDNRGVLVNTDTGSLILNPWSEQSF